MFKIMKGFFVLLTVIMFAIYLNMKDFPLDDTEKLILLFDDDCNVSY